MYLLLLCIILQRISFIFKLQVTIFLFLSPSRILFGRCAYFTNQPITSKNSKLATGKLTWTFFAYFQFVFAERQLVFFFSFRSRKFVTTLFGILRSLGVFTSVKYCGSYSKFSTYLLWSLGPSLFFSQIISLWCRDPGILTH